ncbi:MAG: SUMF1/EgtB/PvdO family nonheme iron enzyme [Bradymonadaceae bacterium]
MTTAICTQCGTRNLASLNECRRCHAVLEEQSDNTGETIRGTPTSSLLNNRWTIVGPVPDADNANLLLGHDTATHQRAVILKLAEKAAGDVAIRQRFLRDAHNLATLNSENVVSVCEVIDTGDQVALVMVRQPGRKLEEVLVKGTRFPLAVVIGLAGQVLAGLQALETIDLHHKKLRPEKVFVTTREGDDGLLQATLVGMSMVGAVHIPELESTHRGTLVGMRKDDVTAAAANDVYKAPEHEGSGVQADIYSLGMILIRALIGELPENLVSRRGAAIKELLKASLGRFYGPQRAETIAAVLGRMVATNLADRYRTIPDVGQALVALLEACPEETMCPVAAGGFLRGSHAEEPHAREEEFPQRMIRLSGYYLDRTPVTAAQFKAFLNATAKSAPPGWEEYNDPVASPFHPVVYVTWEEARAYARWAGKTLPTEAQWEKAARGTDGRTFPWGDDSPTGDHAWFNNQSAPTRVGSFPAGQSPYGALDMAGNVFEWVEDWFDRDYYKVSPDQDPPGPLKGKKKVLRGGSFVHTDFALRCATRGRYTPNERRANHSFRCAWSLT